MLQLYYRYIGDIAFKMFGYKRLCKDYEVVDDKARYGGSYALWQIYAAFHKKTQTPASIFVLNKKLVEKQLFGKDKNVEAFFAVMRKEQENNKIKSLLSHFEPMEEDEFYMVFVTERVLGCLPAVMANEEMSSDMFAFGFCTLIEDIAYISQSGYSGTVTPFNIVVTTHGAWRVVGFGTGSVSTPKFSYEAPPPLFEGSSQTYDSERDLSQAVVSLISSALGLVDPLKVDFADEDQIEFALNALSCRSTTYVETGHCDEQISKLLSIDIFTNELLEKFVVIADEMKTAMCTGIAPSEFLDVVLKKVPNSELFIDIALYSTFNQDLPKMPVNEVQKIEEITDNLIALKKNKQVSQQFFDVVVLEPLTQMLQYEELHAQLIKTLITVGDTFTEPVLLFLLFEPLMIACTLSNYRSKYPLEASNAAFQCFQGVKFQSTGQINYKNPFIEYYQKENKSDYTIPVFDSIISGTKPHALIDTCRTLYENLHFFLNPVTGGRSHFHTINFLASELSIGNQNTELLDNLARNVAFLGDKNWCCAENLVMTEIHSRFMKEYKVKNDKSVILVDPFKPLNSFLVPHLEKIMSASLYQSQVVSCLDCLTNCIDYFLDNEIAAEVLPALHFSMNNIERYPRAMVAFSRFAERCATRCTGKTVAKMFLGRVFNCMYSQEISEDELATLRRIAEDIVAVVFNDVDRKLGVTDTIQAKVEEETLDKEMSELQWKEEDDIEQYPNLLEGILE